MGGGGAGGVESAPDPKPDGALLHAWFASAPDSATTLDVVDARGQVVRRFTTDTARARSLGQQALKAAAGAQRVTWDATYPGPRLLKGQVIWGYTGGVKAPPGSYTARLTSGGATQARSFRLLADPRLPQVTAADYEEQYRASIAVRDSLNAVSAAMETIRAVREQATREGAPVVVLGYPAAFDIPDSPRAIVRQGIVSWVSPTRPGSDVFLIDSHVFPGNSGGPVFRLPDNMDRAGRRGDEGGITLLGIVTQARIQSLPLLAVGKQVDLYVEGNKASEPLLTPNFLGLGLVEPAFRIKQLLVSATNRHRRRKASAP